MFCVSSSVDQVPSTGYPSPPLISKNRDSDLMFSLGPLYRSSHQHTTCSKHAAQALRQCRGLAAMLNCQTPASLQPGKPSNKRKPRFPKNRPNPGHLTGWLCNRGGTRSLSFPTSTCYHAVQAGLIWGVEEAPLRGTL